MSENTVRRRQHEGKSYPDTDDVRLIPVCVIASTCVNAEHTDGGVSPTICARAGIGGNQLPLIVLKKIDI